MQEKRFSSEQIIAELRQIEMQLVQGKSIALACEDTAIPEKSYFPICQFRLPPHIASFDTLALPPVAAANEDSTHLLACSEAA